MTTRRAVSDVKTRIYALDTNVLMHDPSSVFKFKENDVFIPLEVLEELDNNKKGTSEISRNSRDASRKFDEIFAGDTSDISNGLSLEKVSGGSATGCIFFQIACTSTAEKADNRILDAVKNLAKENEGREVILVSKDINMRIKGRATGITVQDYHSDQVAMEDADLLYSGSQVLPENFWDTHSENLKSFSEGGLNFYEVSGPLVPGLLLNEFVRLPGDEAVRMRVIRKSGSRATLRGICDYSSEKNSVWGITALNDEQNYALNLLLDPDIDIVTLLGQAGSGKTLLALAAGLAQVAEKSIYSEIIMTRVTVPIGDDIGFLPGTEEEKMGPWMGALDNNLDVLHKEQDGSEWGRAATRDLLRSRIKVKSLNFMRGRTFLKKYVIIDEVQNLTPKQVKTLITRAGPGTKVICLGNLAQIDTPYLAEGSSGLTRIVDRFKGWENGGHITLLSGERSRLASHANEVL